MAKEFALAVGREFTPAADELLPFTMEDDPDEQLHALMPTESEIAIVAGAMSEYAETGQQVVAIFDLFWSMLSDETARHLRRRLRDRRDPFGLGDVLNVLEWIIEEATARPIQSSSASTPSRPTNGQRSTAAAPRRASTRSRSPRTASAT